MSHEYETELAGWFLGQINEFIRWEYKSRYSSIKIVCTSHNCGDFISINFESCPTHWIARRTVLHHIIKCSDYLHLDGEVTLFTDETGNILLYFKE